MTIKPKKQSLDSIINQEMDKGDIKRLTFRCPVWLWELITQQSRKYGGMDASNYIRMAIMEKIERENKSI